MFCPCPHIAFSSTTTLQSYPYMATAMWLVWGGSLVGALIFFICSSDYTFKKQHLWYGLTAGLCISSFLLVMLSGALSSQYFPLLYVALVVSALRGAIWPTLAFCTFSTISAYLSSGRGLEIFSDIEMLTKLLLLPFMSIVCYFVNISINRPLTFQERNMDARVDRAYSIARDRAAQTEQTELKFFASNRKLYSLVQLFQKLSSKRSTGVIIDEVIRFAREEVRSQIAFIALNDEGVWKTPRFIGINEVTARIISQKIQAGIFNKVIKDGDYINYNNSHYHTQGKGEHITKPFDGNGLRLESLLVVPLKDASGRKPFGILAVANKVLSEKYNTEDIDYLNLLATEAAITLSNMDLYSRLELSYYEMILALAQAIEAKDTYTRGHVSRVEQLSVFICQCIGLDKENTELIAKAAILHDVGKISIPDHILLKPGPLTFEEFQVMKTHASNARLILDHITSLPANMVEIVVHHHERYNGGGYPDQLKGRAIPVGSQIIAVADSYDAMVTDRPYRRGLSREEALKRIREGSGTQFSPYIVEKFLQNVESIEDFENLPHDCDYELKEAEEANGAFDEDGPEA